MTKELIHLKGNLRYEIERCIELFNSQVFHNRSTFTESAFIEVLIRLNHVLQELSNRRNRICWKDDVQSEDKKTDITDLINKMRNAACHYNSPENNIKNSSHTIKFYIIAGKFTLLKLENKKICNEYDNDTAFYYGDKRVYLKRHIERLLRELPEAIDKLNQ